MKHHAGMRFMIQITTVVLLAAGSLCALDITVTDAPYSAIPDDGLNDSAAFAGALAAIVSAGGGTLTVPCGNYHFTSRITADLAAKSVAIRGAGNGVSIIHCANTTGLFWFNNTSNSNQLSVTDLTLMADQTGGTALQVDNPSLSSNNICNLYIEHVFFDALTLDVSYFSHHIAGTNLQQPQFINVFIDNGIVGSCVDGFRIDGVNSPFFDQCYAKACGGINVHLTNAKGNIVLQRMYAKNAVHAGIEIHCTPEEESSVTLTNPHTNAGTEGIHIINADHVSLLEGMAYWNFTVPNYADYIMENCTDVTIKGCHFNQAVLGDAIGRVMIYLKGTTRNVVIQDTIFNGTATRVQQDTDVTGVSITGILDIP
jgi:hypothetical protein